MKYIIYNCIYICIINTYLKCILYTLKYIVLIYEIYYICYYIIITTTINVSYLLNLSHEVFYKSCFKFNVFVYETSK